MWIKCVMCAVSGRLSGPRLWGFVLEAEDYPAQDYGASARREHSSLLAVREVVFGISTISSKPEESPIRNLETRPVP